MNLKNALLMSALICGIISFSGCDSDDPDTSIVIDDQIAHYTFENNAEDQVNSNDGDAENVVYQNGNNGLAAQFNANSYIHFETAFDFPERTVSVWFKPIVVTSVLGVIYVSDNASIENGMTILSVSKISGVPHLSYNAADERHDVEIQEGQWYHAVITVDGNTYALYLDGEQIAEGDIADFTHSGNGATGALLGTSRAFDRYFTGQIDDMRVYDRALSEEEVSALYDEEN